jgi:hypothetical protein
VRENPVSLEEFFLVSGQTGLLQLLIMVRQAELEGPLVYKANLILEHPGKF